MWTVLAAWRRSGHGKRLILRIAVAETATAHDRRAALRFGRKPAIGAGAIVEVRAPRIVLPPYASGKRRAAGDNRYREPKTPPGPAKPRLRTSGGHGEVPPGERAAGRRAPGRYCFGCRKRPCPAPLPCIGRS